MLSKMEINYQVQYTNRKTIGITVERNKDVFIKVPNGTTDEKISNFINKKKRWLYQKINNKQKYQEIPEKEFVSGTSILYLGRNYNLDIGEHNHKGLKFDEKFLLSKNENKNVSKLFKEWFIDKSKEKILPIVEFYAKNLGVEYNQVNFKNLKYRWGSCTSKNNLSFNWRLIKAPLSVINYIVIHELTHILEPKHTKKFWSIVKTQMPKYEVAKNWLKYNGQILEIDFNK